MIKLKNILKEGYVWDRKFGESLPKIQIPTEPINEEDVTEETINEAPEQQMASQLNKVSNTILKITDKFKGKADVDGMTRSWMMGLHARLKKAGIKI